MRFLMRGTYRELQREKECSDVDHAPTSAVVGVCV